MKPTRTLLAISLVASLASLAPIVSSYSLLPGLAAGSAEGLAAGRVPPYTVMNPVAENGLLRFSDLSGVTHPTSGWEVDNGSPMRAFAESRLGPAT